MTDPAFEGDVSTRSLARYTESKPFDRLETTRDLTLAFAPGEGLEIRWPLFALLFASTRVVPNASTLQFPFFDLAHVYVDVFCALSDIFAAKISRLMKGRSPQTRVFGSATLNVRSHASRNGRSRSDYFWSFSERNWSPDQMRTTCLIVTILGASCPRSIPKRVPHVGQHKYDGARNAKQILQVGALRNVSDRLVSYIC